MNKSIIVLLQCLLFTNFVFCKFNNKDYEKSLLLNTLKNNNPKFNINYEKSLSDNKFGNDYQKYLLSNITPVKKIYDDENILKKPDLEFIYENKEQLKINEKYLLENKIMLNEDYEKKILSNKYFFNEVDKKYLLNNRLKLEIDEENLSSNKLLLNKYEKKIIGKNFRLTNDDKKYLMTNKQWLKDYGTSLLNNKKWLKDYENHIFNDKTIAQHKVESNKHDSNKIIYNNITYYYIYCSRENLELYRNSHNFKHLQFKHADLLKNVSKYCNNKNKIDYDHFYNSCSHKKQALFESLKSPFNKENVKLFNALYDSCRNPYVGFCIAI